MRLEIISDGELPMDPRFEEIISNIDKSFHDLLNMAPTTFLNLPLDMPKKRIYLFSEGERHLYVGRSNNIRGRLRRHCSPGATHRMAAFAFRLARESTGNIKASYNRKVPGAISWPIRFFSIHSKLPKIAFVRWMCALWTKVIQSNKRSLKSMYLLRYRHSIMILTPIDLKINKVYTTNIQFGKTG